MDLRIIKDCKKRAPKNGIVNASAIFYHSSIYNPLKSFTSDLHNLI